MASMMQQRSVWTKCFLLFLSPCKKNTKNRCEMFPCRYNSRVKILLIKFIECSYIWFHRVSEKYQKPLLLKSDPIGGQFGLFQLFWWCNKWIPEIQPAANNVYNNNALNKKKSESASDRFKSLPLSRWVPQSLCNECAVWAGRRGAAVLRAFCSSRFI